MGKLIYSAITSLDLYVEDEHGDFTWAAPDAGLHAFVNDAERPIGTYLYGRRMYETMRSWELSGEEAPAVSREYGEIWRAAEKVVFSRTLPAPTTARTRIEREFTPDAVRRLKESSPTDLSVGGAELAAVALAAGLVDEVQLFLMPVLVGGGKPALPRRLRCGLTLLNERRFAGGAVQLRYGVHPHHGAGGTALPPTSRQKGWPAGSAIT